MNEISNPEGAPTTRRPFEPLFPSAEPPPAASPSSPSPSWTPPSSTPPAFTPPPPPPPPPAEQSHSRPQRRRLPVVAALALVAAAITTAVLAGAVGGASTAMWLASRAPVAPARTAGATNGDVWMAKPAGSTVAAESSLLEAVRATRPAVVTVWNLQYVRQTWGSPAQLTPASSGSGVIFDKRGYVATNAHVVDGARSLEVVFIDGRRASATLVNLDANYDVAILKVADGTALPAVAPLGDSASLEPGLSVIAIGSPLGTDYQNTVTSGIIAGLNRRVKDVAPRATGPFGYTLEERDVNGAPLIQTDAAINSGNSGGPLVDLQGEVVGLNTLIVRREGQADVEGFGFAIPSNVVHALADEWIDHHARGCLGIMFAPLDAEIARDQNLTRAAGAYVSGIADQQGAGAKAGLLQGDIIVAVDGVALNLDRGLRDVLWRYRAGDNVTLTLDRGGKTVETKLTLDRCEASAQAPR